MSATRTMVQGRELNVCNPDCVAVEPSNVDQSAARQLAAESVGGWAPCVRRRCRNTPPDYRAVESKTTRAVEREVELREDIVEENCRRQGGVRMVE